ncbi:MAG: ComF family protein [Candidatus Gottesmanbacteria bacterium]
MSLLDIIYPKICLGCGKLGTYCCSHCLESMPKLPYLKCPECERPAIDGKTHPRCQKQFGIDGVISLYPYAGIVKKAIKGIKYRFAFRIIEDLFRVIPEEQLLLLKNIGSKKNICFIPIPLHASRQRLRGFNQAEIIANTFSKIVFIPTQTDVLERIQKTPPQVEMKHRQDRIQNMKQVFSVKKNNIEICGFSIFLVDDVYTTGSTMKSAAEVLKRAGAHFVFGITIAQ